MRRAACRVALLVLGFAALALSGCGSSTPTSPAVLRLEREDLAAVAHTLSKAQSPVKAEVAATKAAWPLVANGLPSNTSTISRPPIRAASASAASLRMPALFEERTLSTITGPGSKLAGAFRDFILLSTRGWQMIGASIDQIEHGSAVAARFARANVDLYIESVYDAHFGLAQIGKQLLAAYKKLGGPAAFGISLTRQEVDELAEVYSEHGARLHPHDGVKLGS
jgi:hypothetical protein